MPESRVFGVIGYYLTSVSCLSIDICVCVCVCVAIDVTGDAAECRSRNVIISMNRSICVLWDNVREN